MPKTKENKIKRDAMLFVFKFWRNDVCISLE